MVQSIHKKHWSGATIAGLGLTLLLLAGCSGRRNQTRSPGADRPFPLGEVTDAHWETQETNAQAAKFIFHDHEFVGETADLAPSAKKHLMQVALRLEHVPFPVVIEESEYNRHPELDQKRRHTVVEQLGRLGVENAEERVIVANSFAEGFTGIEGESAYYSTLNSGRGDGNGFRGGNGRGTYR